MAIIINPTGTLPNGTLINGVANFYTSTKPTVRVDGSALVIGDLWYNLSTQTQWFWNGTYWLSSVLISSITQNINSTAQFNCNFGSDFAEYNIFVEKILWTGKTGTLNSGTAYRIVSYSSYDNNQVNTTLVSNIVNTSAYTASTYFSIAFAWNFLVVTSGTVSNSATPTKNVYYMSSTNVLASGATTDSLTLQYRLSVK